MKARAIGSSGNCYGQRNLAEVGFWSPRNVGGNSVEILDSKNKVEKVRKLRESCDMDLKRFLSVVECKTQVDNQRYTPSQKHKGNEGER